MSVDTKHARELAHKYDERGLARDAILELADEVDRLTTLMSVVSDGANTFAKKNYELIQEVDRLTSELKIADGE